MNKLLKNQILDVSEKLNKLITKRNELTEERNKLLDKKLKADIQFEINKSEKILDTDFKETFGKDNDSIRNSFIRKECKKRD